MNRLFAKARHVYRWLSARRGFFAARLFGLRVPVFPLMHVPDGFTLSHVGKTGVSIVENFCTADEAQAIIDKARVRLQASRITVGNKQILDDYRTSQTASVFDPTHMEPAVLPLLYRAAMLLGVPAQHAESVFVTRYGEGEYYKAHEDFYEGFDGDRLYTVLIYLNDLQDDQGGGTVFERLNIGVRPRLGRAVIWTNTNPDGSRHPETRHEALPVSNGGEKWAIQLWFRAYPLLDIPPALITTPQNRPGQPLQGDEAIPAGAWAVGEVDPESPYAKAFY